MKLVSIRIRAATRDRALWAAFDQMVEIEISSRTRGLRWVESVRWSTVQAIDSNGAFPYRMLRDAWRRARAAFRVPAKYLVKDGYGKTVDGPTDYDTARASALVSYMSEQKRFCGSRSLATSASAR